MKAILTLLLASCLTINAAESAPKPKNQPVITAGAETKLHTPAFTSGFIIESGALTIGKLTIAPPEPKADVTKLVSSLDKTQWTVHLLLIDKAAEKKSIHTSFILVPASPDVKHGLISVIDLPLKDTELALVNSVAGNRMTLIYDEQGLRFQLPGEKESIQIVSKADLAKAHQASLKPGAGKVVSFNQ